MKLTYLMACLCLFLTFSNAQNANTEIIQDFIDNFNNRDSTATLNSLHKKFSEYWQSSLIYKNKKEYSKYLSWGTVMNEHEDIEIIKTTGNKVVVHSTHYSDLDKSLGKMPYKSKKTFIISKGKIIKIVSTKYKGYDIYQNKRKYAFIKFKNWLSKKYKLRRSDFKMNRKDALKLKKIIFEYMAQEKIVDSN